MLGVPLARSSGSCSGSPAPACWSAFSPACSASAAAPSSCRCCTKSSACSVCRKTCACNCASAPRSPLSSRRRCARILGTRKRARRSRRWCAFGRCRQLLASLSAPSLAAFAPAPVFKIAFIVFAAFIGIKMLFVGDRWSLSSDLPGRGALAVYGFITGLFSSLVGVSGGAISNPCSRSTANRCSGRWPRRRASACQSPSPARSATCWPAGGTCPICRRCRSASFR